MSKANNETFLGVYSLLSRSFAHCLDRVELGLSLKKRSFPWATSENFYSSNITSPKISSMLLYIFIEVSLIKVFGDEVHNQIII